MKNLLLIIFFAGLIFWPQVQGPAQSPPSPLGEGLGVRLPSGQEVKPEDSINHLKTEIHTKFDSIAYEINRIAHRQVRYVTRTHIRKVDHYHVDTVLVFIDTCFSRPQLDTSVIIHEVISPDKKQTWWQKIFKRKREKETYLKVIQ